ncbi:MAG: MoaD/ThiS family protein [Granulosicoccaceae bacterium]
MQVTIKAGGAIAEYVPGGSTTLDVANDACVSTVIELLGIPSDKPLMVIVNDDLIPAVKYATTLLAQDDRLSLVQPIQAG